MQTPPRASRSRYVRFDRSTGLAILFAISLSWGCQPNSEQSASTAPQVPASRSDVSTAEGPAVEILISAAASTREIIEKLAEEYSARHRVKIQINPGPSSGLANQIVEGGQADLFLSASREWAQAVVDAKLAVESTELLTNELVIVVPAGNPAGVHTPQDLTSKRVTKIALAGENVPAGKYADQALSRLGLADSLRATGRIARAQDVRGALSFVERGESEAGIVYSTDVAMSNQVQQIYRFDPSQHDEIVYVLVLLEHGRGRKAARDFFHYLQSPAADAVYAPAGFRRWTAKGE